MEIIIAAGIPVIMLLGTYVFGLYTRRNLLWILFCLFWGAVSYQIYFLLLPKLIGLDVRPELVRVIFAPLIQYTIISLGVFFVIKKEKYDNLVDGAVYGLTSGLGYAAYENYLGLPAFLEQSVELAAMQAFSVSLVYATAASIIGVAISQFQFHENRGRRLLLLFVGLGAGMGYTVLFNFLVVTRFGGDILPAVFSVGGVTLLGLYVTGLLRKILIQVGVEKRRADSLLEIVIPIGVELSTEKNFSRLVEKMLLEAKSFCKADAGTLYLMNDNHLEYAVVRNDSLEIAMGGTSGQEITLPPIHLQDETTGEPNYRNVAAYAALTGKTVNLVDAYSAKEFDFSEVKEFDQNTGYQSVSFLTIPLKDLEGKVLGVLQLLNPLETRRKKIVPFDKNLQQLMESFSSLACAALQGYIQEQDLRKEIQDLRIEIDVVKRKEQVDEITDSSYFRDLQRKARGFRDTRQKEEASPE